jgi:signal transduction histidine kinase
MNKYPQLQDTEVIKALESSVSSTIDIIFGSLIFVGVTLQISFLTTGDVIHSIISGILLMLLVAVFFVLKSGKIHQKNAPTYILIVLEIAEVISIFTNPGGLTNPIVALSLPFIFVWMLLLVGRANLKYVVLNLLVLALLSQLINNLGISENLAPVNLSSDNIVFLRSLVLLLGTCLGIWVYAETESKILDFVLTIQKRESGFFARMSHEIRNPLHVIQSTVEMATGEEDKRSIRESLWIIDDAANQMKLIADELLDYKKLSDGALYLNPQTFNLHDHVQEQNAYFKRYAEVKGITVTSETQLADIPQYIVLDKYRLKQITTNLMTNAIKYIGSGSEIITKSTYDRARQLLTITVTDNGIGMSKETLTNLFMPYAVALDNPVAAYSGTGLGLVICRGIAEAMKGSLTAESELHKGSTFTLSVPAPIPEKLPSKKSENIQVSSSAENHSGDLRGVTILCVDDSSLNLLSYERPLKLQGAEVYIYENPHEALECALTKHVDLVITDIAMPGMDGMDLLAQIKQVKPELVVIAVTGNAMSNEIEEYKQRGFSFVLTKPFKANDLIKTVLSVLNKA